MYDYLIVGAGLFGATFARIMTDAGKKCLVLDRRNHIAGNVYTLGIVGVNVHRYGAHSNKQYQGFTRNAHICYHKG